jgi:lipopolysaccharide/colanic/teichoic acid biosynthesis glycosyltransferase
MKKYRQLGAARLVKRALDIGLASVAMVVASPLLAGAAIAIRAGVGTPVLFRQRRPGLGSEPFELVKFRTMSNARGPDGELLPDGERLTKVGRFLRASSIDELPQLWNVLKGDMSLVGPRPLLMQYLARYTPEQARRHEVRPGITGWAQVNGRNALSWEEKFRLDVWYVDHWSLALDARIVAMTVARVFRRSGIASAGHATMPEFFGSPPKVADPLSFN